MSVQAIREKCWNHTGRAAVCRCPGCSRMFCRECVTEHDVRLLCATCVAKLDAPATKTKRGLFSALMPAAALTGSLMLAWLSFFALALALAEIARRSEVTQ